MTDFGDDAGQMLGTQSERIATEVLRAMLSRARGKGPSASFGSLEPGLARECRAAMARVDFDPESPDNIHLDFKTVKWDPGAKIMTDRFKAAGIPYDMQSVSEEAVRFTLHPESAPFVKRIADGYIDSDDKRLESFTEARFPNYGVLSGESPAARRPDGGEAPRAQSAEPGISPIMHGGPKTPSPEPVSGEEPGFDFDPESPDNIHLDFKTVKWDPGAKIMTDRFKAAGIPYDMQSVSEEAVRFTLHPESAPFVKRIADGYIDSDDKRLESFTEARFPNYGVLSGESPAARRPDGGEAPRGGRTEGGGFSFRYRPGDEDPHAPAFRAELDGRHIPYEESQVSSPESVLGEELRFDFDACDAPAVRRIADELRRRYDPKGVRPIERRFPDYKALVERTSIPSESSAEDRDVVRFAVPDREAAKLIEECFAEEGIAYETFAETNGDTVFVMFDAELRESIPAIKSVEKKIGSGEASRSAARSADARERAKAKQSAQPKRTFDADGKGARKYEYARKIAPEEAARQARASAKARNARQTQGAEAKVRGR